MQLYPGENVVLQQSTVWYSAPARPGGVLTLTNFRLVFELYSGGFLYPGMDVGLDKLMNAFIDNVRGDLFIDTRQVLSVDSPYGRASFDLPNPWPWVQAIQQAKSNLPPPPPPPLASSTLPPPP